MSTDNIKNLIREALRDPDFELPADLEDRLDGEDATMHKDHRLLDQNLKAALAGISARFDGHALDAESFKKRLLNSIEADRKAAAKAGAAADAGFFRRMRLRDMGERISQAVFGDTAVYRWAPVAILLLLALPALPYVLNSGQTDSSGGPVAMKESWPGDVAAPPRLEGASMDHKESSTPTSKADAKTKSANADQDAREWSNAGATSSMQSQLDARESTLVKNLATAKTADTRKSAYDALLQFYRDNSMEAKAKALVARKSELGL